MGDLLHIPKAPCLIGTCVTLVLLAIILTLSLVLSSFQRVDEGMACLRVSSYSGEMEEQPYLTASREFIGLASSYVCMPKTIQEIEFVQGGIGVNRILGTRTKEGLFINLDVHIEYRIIPENVALLYEQFGEWENVVSNFTLIARSEIRNTASRYGGLDYMDGDRTLIANDMQTDLDVALGNFHATVQDVNIRHIELSSAFEQAFESVRDVKLSASKAVQTREVDISQEVRANQSLVINLLAERESILLNARAQATRVALEREAQLTNKRTEIITEKLKAESSRRTTLNNAQIEVNKARAEREAKLTEARIRNSELTLAASNSRGVVLIDATSQVTKTRAAREAALTAATTAAESDKLRLAKDRSTQLLNAKASLSEAVLQRTEAILNAQTQLEQTQTREAARLLEEITLANVRRLEANATADALAETEGARIEGVAARRAADESFVTQLQSKANLTPAQVLRYMHLQALAQVSDGASALFVDYEKVPLMLETGVLPDGVTVSSSK